MTPPSCPIHEECGACASMGLPIDEQLASKAAEAAQAVGCPVDEVHASPHALGYRARISLRPDAQGRLGYYRPRSHDHVPVPACAIARPELNRVLAQLPPLPGLAEVELRSDGEAVVLSAWSQRRTGRRRGARGSGAALRGVDWAGTGLAGVALDGRAVYGDVVLRRTVAGITHLLGPSSFMQVNLEVNALLVERVRDEVLARQPSAVLDLYAGAGNLGLPLALAGLPLTMIDSVAAAIADARATVARHGLEVDVRRADAGRFQAGDAFFDVAVLDPPRTGAHAALAQLLVTRPRAIVYVSCNPRTLGHDLGLARGAGYNVARLEVFDMFPQTRHAEALCVLERPA